MIKKYFSKTTTVVSIKNANSKKAKAAIKVLTSEGFKPVSYSTYLRHRTAIRNSANPAHATL